ncbi:unnamed protein product [Blepharisma stoltei]|uniref:Tubulin/FtsZ 2-layer sandwich domain-containing protein n=1 Tax=Blepharisma stoltei TaxID=1481888 RepID=A0AAU9J9Y7_9CILI|nr:unnamed protein product [Blepharisma stoltei]
MSLVLHNEAIYDICNQKLDIERPTYTNINKIIAQVVSGMTVSLRYYDSLNVDLYEFNKNLVPFPKVHFLLSSYAPFLSTVRAYHKDPSVFDITDLAFDSAHMMAKCDPTNGRYIACNLKYMGDVIPKDANAAIIKAREKLRIQSADWWYVGIRCGFCYNAQ